VRKEARVRTERAAHAVQLAIPRASVQAKLWASATRVATKPLSSTTAPSDEVCERCQELEHGHNEADCPKPRCKACGSSDHGSARSFDCPEHKCSKCKGAIGPKGHNKAKNNYPEILNAIRTLCGEIGHDKERCPTRPCPACGCRTHRLPTHFDCPEHVCTACDQKGHNRTNCPNNQCATCGLFEHLPDDCPFVNCVG
jgi:hypothetical protein